MDTQSKRDELISKIDEKTKEVYRQYNNPELINYFCKIFIKIGDNPARDNLLKFYKNYKESGLQGDNDEDNDSLIQDIEDLYIPTPEQQKLFEDHLNTLAELRDLTGELRDLVFGGKTTRE